MVAVMSTDIAQRPDHVPTNSGSVDAPVTVQQSVSTSGVTLEATRRIAGLGADGAKETTTDLEKEVNIALSLLLKHRGGPGFGHGRLEGEQLDLLEQKLRSVASRLRDEAANA